LPTKPIKARFSLLLPALLLAGCGTLYEADYGSPSTPIHCLSVQTEGVDPSWLSPKKRECPFLLKAIFVCAPCQRARAKAFGGSESFVRLELYEKKRLLYRVQKNGLRMEKEDLEELLERMGRKYGLPADTLR